MEESEIAEDMLDDDDLKDKINQRREARRRKILLNARRRLNVLSGRGEGDEECDSQGIEHSGSFHNIDDEPDVLADYVPQPPPSLSTYKQEDLNDFFSGFRFRPMPKRHYLLRYRVHVAVVAVLSFIYAIISSSNFIEQRFYVYVPVGACIIFELLFFREQPPLNPIINILLTLSGLKAEKITVFFQLVGTLQHLFADICLSTFLFSAMSLLLTYVHDGFSDLIIFT